MTTSELTQLTLEISTSLQGDSPASPIPKRVSAKRQKTIGIYGPNSTASFASFSPDGACLRTFGGYLVARLDGSLEEFSGTWPAQALMQNGQLFQLRIWEPATEENEFGLLPIPTASEQGGRKPEYLKLHFLLKFIIVSGVFCIVLIEPSVLIHGKKLISTY